MVLLSAGIMTRHGNVLLSRQFVPIERVRIENLLAAFPKLVSSEDVQHTFIEANHVRYVYQPLENLYLLLITNKTSNILEDLATLRLMAKIVSEYAGGSTKELVLQHQFELVFAFDELVSVGHKEHVTLQQVKQYLEMDSHEEKLQQIIMESKISETQDIARRKAEALDKKKTDMELAGVSNPSYSGGSGFGSENFHRPAAAVVEAEPARAPSFNQRNSFDEAKMTQKKAVKGMQLGKKKTTTDAFLAAFSKEERIPVGRPTRGRPAVAHPAEVLAPMSGPVANVEEKLLLALHRDGEIRRLEVKGQIQLRIMDPEQARVAVHTNGPLKRPLQSRLHPKIDKQRWNKEGVLVLKDPEKPFPLGEENAPIILRWRFVSTSEDEIPLSVNFWPSSENGRSVVSVEVTQVKELGPLNEVYLSIPCPGSEHPSVTQVDGETTFLPHDHLLSWYIPKVEAEETYSLEFSVPEVDSDEFYPLQVTFACPTTYSGLTVTKIVTVQDEKPQEFTALASLAVEKFLVE